MSDRVELLQKIEEALSAAIELLLEERDDVVAIPEGPQAQWDLFRALVNTRPPIPASGAVPYVCGVVTSRRWASMPS